MLVDFRYIPIVHIVLIQCGKQGNAMSVCWVPSFSFILELALKDKMAERIQVLLYHHNTNGSKGGNDGSKVKAGYLRGKN